MSPIVNICINLLVWVVVIAVIIAIVVSKLKEKPLEWPELADYGEPQEIWLEGMADLDVFPQYGYHRYRDVYLNMRRIPVVVVEPKIIEGQLAYHFYEVKNGEEGFDLPSAVMLLGTEKPAEITRF